MQSAARIDPTHGQRTWRTLGPADAAAVHGLHLAATEAVGRPDLIRPESRAFFETLLAGGGWLCGTFDDAELLAYGVLQWELPPEENLRPLLGLPPDAPFAKLAGAAVRPGLWGSGLHEDMIGRRLAEARHRGLLHLYATSAPGNARSWENLLNRGFGVRALVEQYGGHLRYVVYRRLDDPPAPDGEGTWCGVADIEEQRRLLHQGLAGTAWRRTGGDGREICWRPIP